MSVVSPVGARADRYFWNVGNLSSAMKAWLREVRLPYLAFGASLAVFLAASSLAPSGWYRPILLLVFGAGVWLQVAQAPALAQPGAVYGRRKMKAALRRENGINLDKDRIARLMRELGIRGATRTRSTITTRSDRSSPRAPDLVNRRFRAERPNQLWVCDFTYLPTWSGFAQTAFVTDVFSRRIVGWRTADTMTADLVTDALEMAIFSRRHRLLIGVIAHSDAGGQYVSVAYTERLADIHALSPIGPIDANAWNSARRLTQLVTGGGPIGACLS